MSDKDVITDVNPNETPKRKRGRPKKIKPDMRDDMRSAMRSDEEFVYSPDEEADRLKVPREVMKEGMDYLWVTASVYGQPQPQRLVRFQRQGWQPVPADSPGFDGLFMPKGWKGQIEVDGLVLHQRSKKISDLARQYERRKAVGQIRAKEAQLVGGDLGTTLDSQHPSALRTNKISKSYETIDIKDDK